MEIGAVPARGMDRETLRQLSCRSDARGLAQLAGHFLLLGATGYGIWASRGTVWVAPAILLYGIVLVFLFCPLHEAIHRTAFATRALNDAIAWVCGVLLALPPAYFRLFHFAHHRHTQDPALDPELAQPRPGSMALYLWHLSGLPYWIDRLSVTLRLALTGRVVETFIPAEKRAIVVREARIVLLVYVLALGSSLLLRRADVLMYWVLPALCGQPFLRLFLLAEHIDCPLNEDMFANTRTTYTTGAVRFLAWQMPFHAEHHAFPSIPFHALATANQLVRQRLETTSRGYLALHRGLVREFAGQQVGTGVGHTARGKAR
jgi:fatty acid desaturase